jgi:hypothetical protein
LGREHSTCGLFKGNYAEFLWTRGRLREASRAYEEAVGVLEKRLPSGHPDLTRLRARLASLTAARQSAWTVSLRDLKRTTAR